MTHSDGGKGSARRPGEGYQDAWERIFGKDKPKMHHFVHDGWGKYHCQRCGKKEDYSHHGETCPKGDQ